MSQAPLLTDSLDDWIGEKTELKDRLNPETLREWQLSRFRETLAYAKKQSRFYRQTLSSVKPDSIVRPEDLNAVPFTAAADIRQECTRFVCLPQKGVARIMTLNTSGSSGPPKRIFFSQSDQELCVDFFARGMRRMAGPGDTVRIYLGKASPGNTVDMLIQGLKRNNSVGLACSFDDFLPRALSAKEKKACDCLVGIPAWMLRMAETHPDLRPKSVLLCWDYIPKAIVRRIRDIWQCRIFTHYGSTESGLGGAVSCADSPYLHPRAADLLLEIIDPHTGRTVPEGKYGEIVFTTLTRQAMPLIRYRTGDISRLCSSACVCGSALPCLDAIQGRLDNAVALPGGGTLSIHLLDELLFSMPGVLDYSAGMPSPTELRLCLHTRAPGDLSPLRRQLTEQYGASLSISIHTVQKEFPFLPGKRLLLNT